MTVSTILNKISTRRRYTTTDDIRDVFGDYHNALRWFAGFLSRDEKLIDACIVDACTIAETQTPEFHEWLVHWAARATVRCAFHSQQARIAELASDCEKGGPVERGLVPLSAAEFRLLVKNSNNIRARLDVFCRFVLVLRGIAKDSCPQVATQLGVSASAVEQAYRIAYAALADLTTSFQGGVRCSA